jgi:hypothetical protein
LAVEIATVERFSLSHFSRSFREMDDASTIQDNRFLIGQKTKIAESLEASRSAIAVL